ncbi:MAG: MBL fold metallo-hydrolase [Bacteroidota bacterium]
MPKIGNYTLHTVETGRFGLDGGAMFGIVPKPLWERKIPADAKNRIPLNMRCLLLEGEDRLMLVDNGLGDKYDEKFASIFAVDQEYASLERSLNTLGYTADDVTDLIITHLHFDHCGGSTRRVGDKLEVVFKNARHHVQREHWDWAQHPNVRERNSFLKENLQPLEDAGVLNFLDGKTQLAPGIEVFVAHGHTEAMQLVKIADGSTTLVYTADLLPTHAHIPSAWNMAYDLQPMVTIEEKEAFLAEAVAKNWHLFFEHDPEVAVASLKQTDRGVQVVDTRTLAEL